MARLTVRKTIQSGSCLVRRLLGVACFEPVHVIIDRGLGVKGWREASVLS